MAFVAVVCCPPAAVSDRRRSLLTGTKMKEVISEVIWCDKLGRAGHADAGCSGPSVGATGEVGGKRMSPKLLWWGGPL